jgi:ParB family chromosome partitioning protein
LGSLLGDPATGSLSPEAERQEIPLDRIRPNPFQPRKVFDGEGLEELRESILRHGVLQPIVVRPTDGGFELVSGERRWRAAQQAGLSRIPAVVRAQVSDDDLLELALVENLQRRDLDPIERARGFQVLLERLNLTQQEVAERVGLKRTSVANHLRLLELPEAVQTALTKGLIQMGHAKALLGLATPKAMMGLLGDIVRQDLSVRQVEERVRERQAKGPTVGVRPAARPPWARDLERRMEEHLGAKVQLQGQAERGRIVIEYGTRGDLDRLAERLAPRPTL